MTVQGDVAATVELKRLLELLEKNSGLAPEQQLVLLRKEIESAIKDLAGGWR